VRIRCVLQMWMSTLFGAKNIKFFEIYGVRTDKGEGGEPVQTFCEQGERGSIFRDFVQTPFMDGPLRVSCFCKRCFKLSRRTMRVTHIFMIHV